MADVTHLAARQPLAFTPPSLAGHDNPPPLTLRPVGAYERRFLSRLYVEEGIRNHDLHEIRGEVLAGLKALWEPEAFERHSPMVEEFWRATDDFASRQASDPTLVWSYDPDIERAVQDLTQRVAQSWPPLRRMLADNAEFATMTAPLLVAIVVQDWSGLAAPRRLDRGFLTLGCAEALKAVLAE